MVFFTLKDIHLVSQNFMIICLKVISKGNQTLGHSDGTWELRGYSEGTRVLMALGHFI